MGLRLKLEHVNSFIDRHGRPRYYLRAPWMAKSIPLHKYGAPFSPPFMAAYHAGLAGKVAEVTPLPLGESRSAPGTIGWLIGHFLDCSDRSSSPFKTWKLSTQQTRRRIYERFRESDGKKRIFDGERRMLLRREHMQIIINQKGGAGEGAKGKRKGGPFAQRNFIKAMKPLFEWAAAEGRIPDDPMLGIKEPKMPKTTGFAMWTEEEIARFEAAYPPGTKEYLAFALLLYTGQRRSDVIRMGKQHMVKRAITRENSFEWWLVFEPVKTKGRKREPLDIPMHPKLLAAIEACPSGHLAFLTTRRGTIYSANRFTNWIIALAREVGIDGRSPHGLRKACATRLADLGCSAHMIKSITGHASLAEVQRYTEAADRRRAAAAAMARMVAGERDGEAAPGGGVTGAA